MAGLLGVLAAGAARGARDVSNVNVAADREALRQKYEQQYEEYKYQRGRAAQKEDIAAMGAIEEQKYQRSREDKLSDTEAERKFKAEESAKDRASREKAAGIRASRGRGSGSGKAEDEGIMLDDGSMFYPNDADSKAAANLVKIGFADNIQDAYRLVYAKHYSGQAAGSIEGLTEGTVKTSKEMSKRLLQTDEDRQPIHRRYNPATGTFE